MLEEESDIRLYDYDDQHTMTQFLLLQDLRQSLLLGAQYLLCAHDTVSHRDVAGLPRRGWRPGRAELLPMGANHTAVPGTAVQAAVHHLATAKCSIRSQLGPGGRLFSDKPS